MDYTNKALGLRVQTQIPLNVKGYIENEAALSNLGPGDNLAYIYEKGLVVFCIEEGTRYEWKEIEVGDVGLLPSNFVYPDNVITFGIDYSNKEYNFVEVFFNFNETPDATTILKGKLKLSGDLGGTADSPTTPTAIHKTGNETKTGNLTVNSIIKAGGTSSQFLKADGSTSLIDGSETKINAGTNISKTGTGTIADPYVINNLIVVDGSETKIIDGVTTTKSGLGTIASPYKIETINLQKAITTNYLVTVADNNYSIKINNGVTPITITIPISLPENFFLGFTQKGTGDVTFVGSGGATITNPIGLKIKGQGYHVGVEQIGTSNTFDLLGFTKF